jgi:hypothetical protein
MLKQYVLAELRAALLRTQTAAADLKAIGIALSEGLITPEQAADEARAVNAHHLGAPVPFIDPPEMINPPKAEAA